MAWSPPGHDRRRLRRTLAALALAVGICLLAASSALAQAPIRVLVFHGPPDATVDAGVAALEDLGEDNDFEVAATQNAADFTAANLAGYRAVVFLDNEATVSTPRRSPRCRATSRTAAASSASVERRRPSPARASSPA